MLKPLKNIILKISVLQYFSKQYLSYFIFKMLGVSNIYTFCLLFNINIS